MPNYISQIDFGDGVVRTLKAEGGGGITDFVDIPTVEETELDYDGTEKTLVFENLDTDKVTVSGTSSATEMGQYTCTLTLKSEKYYWKDLTNTPKTIEWSIITPSLFGAEWDGTANTAWTRTDSAQNYVDPEPYVSGASTYSSPFDLYMPWAGMTVEERTGGTMVKIPKFWYKITQNGAAIKIQISNIARDGFSVSPAHMDRGDGRGERNVAYVGRYMCSSNYKSETDMLPKSDSRASARTTIHNLGSNIWQSDFAMRFTLWLLYLVEFANWNSQAKIGYGCGDNSKAYAVGYTDSMPYHTGTTQSSRTAYGLGIQYRNIEGLWDNGFEWCDGCYYNSGGLNIILNPNNFSDSSGGISVGVPTNGWAKRFTYKNVNGTFELFIPTALGGYTNSYSCDRWGFDSSQPRVKVGGEYVQSLDYGLFSVDSASQYTGAYCRLMELP